MKNLENENRSPHGLYYLEKAYDRLPQDVLWWALAKNKVPSLYINTIKDMCGVVTISNHYENNWRRD